MNKKLRSCTGALLQLTAALLVTVGLNAQQPAGSSSAPASQQSPIHEFTLAQTIDYAAKNSVKVKNALLDYSIQEQSNRATVSQALPQVSGSAGLTDYLQLPAQVVPGSFIGQPQLKLVPFKFGTQYSASAGVSLKQILFDGQVFVGLQARQTSLEYYTKAREVTEVQLRENITKVYYQLLLSKVQVQLIDANIAHAQELLHNSSEMFKNGFAERLDVDKATVQLTNLQSNKVLVLYNIDNGYLGLKVLMGMPVRDSLVLTDSLTYEMVREGSLVDSFKYSDRKDYQLLEINRRLNEYDIKRYKKQYIPTASVSAYYTQSGYGLDFSDIYTGKYWYPGSYVSLNINVPIFDGFYKDANIKQAKLKLMQTQNNIESLEISIDNDVKNAQLKFGAALADLDFQKKNMDLASGVYDQTRKKFEQGLGSNTEITAAQTDLIQAQNNYFNALYNAISAKVDYQYAIGKL